jgi:hypothetical protein
MIANAQGEMMGIGLTFNAANSFQDTLLLE